MTEDRFNALTLWYVHKDIDINISHIIDMYAGKHPRSMCFVDPLNNYHQ
jgi:hypothetical protein